MKSYKLCMAALKYLVLLNGVEMLAHVCILTVGYDISVMLYLLLFQCAVVLMFASRALGFCLLHRLFIIYSHLIVGCVIFEKYTGFGILLTPTRILAIIMGFVLVVMIIFKEIKKHARLDEDMDHTDA